MLASVSGIRALPDRIGRVSREFHSCIWALFEAVLEYTGSKTLRMVFFSSTSRICLFEVLSRRGLTTQFRTNTEHAPKRAAVSSIVNSITRAFTFQVLQVDIVTRGRASKVSKLANNFEQC